MDRVVCSFRGGDQELGIDDAFLSSYKIHFGQRVHVMNQDVTMNIVARDPKIAPQITNDNYLSCRLPLSRPIERLVHPPIEAEGLLSYVAAKVEVLEALLESG